MDMDFYMLENNISEHFYKLNYTTITSDLGIRYWLVIRRDTLYTCCLTVYVSMSSLFILQVSVEKLKTLFVKKIFIILFG